MTAAISTLAVRGRLQRTLAPPQPARNPFLAIHSAARHAFAIYLFLYYLVFPVIDAISDPTAQDLLYPRIAAQALYVALLAAPFVVVKGGGWLHPLFLLPIVRIISSIFRNPIALLAPFQAGSVASGVGMVSFSVPTISVATSLTLPVSTLAEHRLLLTLLYCLGLAAYYAGYHWGRRVRIPSVQFVWPRRLRAVSVGFVGCAAIGAAYVILMSGGLTQHLVLMRSGRQELFAEVGPILVIATFAPFMVLLWFAYESRPFYRPLFVITAVTSALVPLLTTGSRSSVIYPLAALIVLWWHKRNRILLLPSAVAVVIALAAMGGFGALRQDFRSTEVDWSVLSPDRVVDWFDSSTSEMNARGSAEPDLAALAGAQGKGSLWGRSYLNTVLFWLPRGVWPDKPRAIGTYNMWINFADAALDEPSPSGDVWGIPVSWTIEAFWNFQLPGIVLVGLLLGGIHRTLTAAAIRYSEIPAVLPIVVYLAISINGTGQSLTRGIRDLLLIYLVLKLMGAFGRKRARRRLAPLLVVPRPRLGVVA